MNGLADDIDRSIEAWGKLRREIEDIALEAFYSGDELMPMNRSLYPDEWEDIAQAVKDAADWTCQECGKPCRMSGETIDKYLRRMWARKDWSDEWEPEVHQYPQRFTLTVAHLDHDPANCEPANLRALCSVCHLRYDAAHHAANAAETRRRNAEEAGQLNFLGDE